MPALPARCLSPVTPISTIDQNLPAHKTLSALARKRLILVGSPRHVSNEISRKE